MARFLFVALVAACAVAVSAQDASTNYNAGDHGRSETVSPDGTVQGQYSYTGGDGKVYTVKYRAGKDGYQVEGDHLPKSPQPQAPQGQSPQQQPQQNFYNQQPQQYQHPNSLQGNNNYNPFNFQNQNRPQQQYQPQQQQYQPQQQQYQPQQQQYQPQQQQYQPQPQQQNYNNQGDEDGSYNPVLHTQYAYKDDSNQY